MIRTSNGRGGWSASSAPPMGGRFAPSEYLRRREVAGQRRESFTPGRRHQQIVLNPDAAPTWQIHARLDRHDHARR